MNGYNLLAQSYVQILKQGNCTDKETEEMKRDIQALTSIGNLPDEETRMAVFDTGAFNNVVQGYCKKAMSLAGMKKKETDAVMKELHILMDSEKAIQILKEYMGENN